MRKFKTLIVEDSSEAAAEIKSYFSEHDSYDVIDKVATTVDKAKELIDEYEPDFVLLDIELTYDDLGGIKVAEYLQDKKAVYAFLTSLDEDIRVLDNIHIPKIVKKELLLIPKCEWKDKKSTKIDLLTRKIKQHFTQTAIFIAGKYIQVSSIIYAISFRDNESNKQKVDFYCQGEANPISSLEQLIFFDKELKINHPHFNYAKTNDYIINIDKIKSIRKISKSNNIIYIFSFDMRAFINKSALEQIEFSRKRLKLAINDLHNRFPEEVKLKKKS